LRAHPIGASKELSSIEAIHASAHVGPHRLAEIVDDCTHQRGSPVAARPPADPGELPLDALRRLLGHQYARSSHGHSLVNQPGDQRVPGLLVAGNARGESTPGTGNGYIGHIAVRTAE